MATETLCFDGLLADNGSSWPVTVRYASRYSLWLRFDGKRPRTWPTEYEKLTVHVDGKAIEMGCCDLAAEPDGPDGEYRLVPKVSIHDVEQLFFRSRVAVLESAAVNLPLILGYKQGIDPVFSHYVSDLTYDLSAYRTMFDEIDAGIVDEPEQVRSTLREGIVENIGTQLLDYLDAQYSRLRSITSAFADEQHERHGYFFRKQLWNVILCAPIMARTNLKPRGYIGDSEMMRMIYENAYRGESTFGMILHKHAVRQPAADAVRNRRGSLVRALQAFLANRTDCAGTGGSRVKVLSVACGPAAELSDMLQTREDCERLHFSLLDQDRHALLEAASVVEGVERKLGTAVSSDFIRESVRTMLFTRELQERWGRFDFIYSMGLFDYLTRPVAVAVLTKLYSLLVPGGEILVGNFSVDNPTREYMAYWMDWTILYRTRSDMLSIAAEAGCAEPSVDGDDTGIQLLLRMKKPNG